MSEKKQFSVDEILADIKQGKERQNEASYHTSGSVDVDRLVADILREKSGGETAVPEKPAPAAPVSEPARPAPEAQPAEPAEEAVPVHTERPAPEPEKPKFTLNIRFDDTAELHTAPKHEQTPAKPDTISTVDLLAESLAEELGGKEVPAQDEPEHAEEAVVVPVEPVTPPGEEVPSIPVEAIVELDAVDEPTRYIDEEGFLKARQNREQADMPAVPQPVIEIGSEPKENPDAVEYHSPADERAVYTEILSTRKRMLLSTILLAVFGGLSLLLVAGQEFFPQLLPSVLRMNEQPLVYLVVQFVLLVSSILVCSSSVGGGLLSALRLRPNRDSLAAFAALFSLVQFVICFFKLEAVTTVSVHLYAVVVIGSLLCNSVAKFFATNRMILNFRIVSSSYDKYVTSMISDENVAMELTRGVVDDIPTVVFKRKAEFVDDFIAYSTDEDPCDRQSKFLTPLGIAFAALLGGVSYFMTNSLDTALTTAAAVLCVFSPFSYLFSVCLPLSRTVHRYHKHGGVILSTSEMDDFCYTNAVVVPAQDLFPENSIRLFGIKTFAGQRIDEALMDAASVIDASGSVLSGVFAQIIGGDHKLLRPVDTLVYEDGMGISAWVANKRVLIGSRELMINHGISVPSRDYEERYLNEGHELVYLSTSGELTAVFLTKFFAAPEVKASIRKLEDNGIRLIVKSVDAVITQQKLGEVFDKDPSSFKILPARLHATFDELAAPAEKDSSSVVSNGTFRSFTGSLVAAKRMKIAVLLGSILQFAAIGLGLLLVIILTMISGMSQMKVLSLFIYELVWLVATVLIPRLKSL